MKLNRFQILIFLATIPLFARGQNKFYNYYSSGLEFMEKKDWVRAISEFKSAASLEFEDTKRKRTYGVHFIEYLPHREMGVAYFNLGESSNSKGELELSKAYVITDRTEEYLRRISPAIVGTLAIAKPAVAEEKKAETKPTVEEQKPPLRTEGEKSTQISTKQDVVANTDTDVRLSYDPNSITQVGSRLALAVIPFEGKGDAAKFVDEATEKMITRLVNLRRFKVIERTALDKIMKEQKLQASGIVDDRTAVNLGKLSGADAMVAGSVSFVGGKGKLSARVIDVETGETIAARDAPLEAESAQIVDRVVDNIAAMIFNDLPLVEGYVVKVDETTLYIDMGLSHGVRKGTKCVVYREGEPIKHPITGEILGKKVTKLGELVVIQSQDKMAEGKPIEAEEGLKVGDKVVVK
jgi:TolB-like protein